MTGALIVAWLTVIGLAVLGQWSAGERHRQEMERVIEMADRADERVAEEREQWARLWFTRNGPEYARLEQSARVPDADLTAAETQRLEVLGRYRPGPPRVQGFDDSGEPIVAVGME